MKYKINIDGKWAGDYPTKLMADTAYACFMQARKAQSYQVTLIDPNGVTVKSGQSPKAGGSKGKIT